MSAPSARTQCIAFLTHVWSPAIARHYRRLQQEAGAVMPVHLVYQPPDNSTGIPAGMAPDVVIRTDDYRRRFPVRSGQIAGPLNETGHVDLPWLTAFENPVFAGFQDFWMIENDVDFSGHWADFFRQAATYEGDLLAARIYRLSDNPRFWYADTLRWPADQAPRDPLVAFFPISRISRRALAAYAEAIANPDLAGHMEIIWPTVLEAAGMHIADLGGHGPSTPAARRGLHYNGRLDSSRNDGSTHGFRPPRGYHYFGDRPAAFREPDRIYHPIKSEMTREARREADRKRLKRWWLRTRESLTGRKSREARFTE